MCTFILAKVDAPAPIYIYATCNMSPPVGFSFRQQKWNTGETQIQHKCNETQSLHVCFHRALLGALPSLYWRRQGLNNYSGAFLRPVLFRTSQPSWLSIDKGLILHVLRQYIDVSLFPIFGPSKSTPNFRSKGLLKRYFYHYPFLYFVVVVIFGKCFELRESILIFVIWNCAFRNIRPA